MRFPDFLPGNFAPLRRQSHTYVSIRIKLLGFMYAVVQSAPLPMSSEALVDMVGFASFVSLRALPAVALLA